jgi:hypothetical protein
VSRDLPRDHPLPARPQAGRDVFLPRALTDTATSLRRRAMASGDDGRTVLPHRHSAQACRVRAVQPHD